MKHSPIIITGMHRSGTTILSKILENQGLYLGRKKDTNNESLFFQGLNKWIMKVDGSSWDNPISINEKNRSNEIILNRIIKIVNSRLNFVYFNKSNAIFHQRFDKYNNKWGWKDPRNIFTLNIWAEIFNTFKIINVIRHPYDVALSLLARYDNLYIRNAKDRSPDNLLVKYSFLLPSRNNSLLVNNSILNINDALELYIKYYTMMNKNIELYEGKVLNVKYEDLLTSPEDTVKEILIFCEMNFNEGEFNKILNTININNGYKFLSDKTFTKPIHSKIDKILKKLNYIS